MKKFLLGTVGLIALGMAPASAADLAARPYTKAPPIVAAIYDWSGFYIGANGGYASRRNCANLTAAAGVAFSPALPEGCNTADGGIVGGQIGYRWQMTNWVFGLEAQGDYADLRGSNTNLQFLVFPGDTTNSTRVRALGLFTGQIGYAWNNTLLYAKGGAAVTDNRYQKTGNFGPAAGIVNTATNTRWGGVVGVGLEYGFAPNWSVGVEYDHIFMDRRTVNYVSTVPALATSSSIRGDLDMVTARINYRWGGPVVARY